MSLPRVGIPAADLRCSAVSWEVSDLMSSRSVSARRVAGPVLLLLCALAGCSQPAAKPAATAPAACPDQSAKLPGTGLCQKDAAALLAFAEGERPPAPSGCDWVVNETEMAGGDYLLYRAARCKGKVTQLAYAGGAQMAELTYAVSAMTNDADKGRKAVRIAGAEPGDRNAYILNVARAAMKNKAEAARCQVRLAKFPNWPADALVVDVSAADAAKAPKDEPRTACGPYGLDEDSQTFWRVFGGLSWFFELGQDDLEIDPGSFTLVHQEDNGRWARSEE